MMGKHVISLLAGLLLPATVAGDDRLPDWAHRNSADCGRCHDVIAAEWLGSQHARSTLEKDPLYRFLQKEAVKVLGPKAERKCRQCHYPPWEGKIREAGRTVEGVSCVVCHRVHPDHPDKDLPNGPGGDFALGKARGGGVQGLCLTCHDELKNPEGHPVCTTGPEAVQAGTGTCVDCHMPPERGAEVRDSGSMRHRSHRFPGGHDRAFLVDSATVSLSLTGEKTDRMIRVRVQVGKVGHSLPTGNPMRSLLLRVQALDPGGRILWSNTTANPLKEAPEALFMRVFRGADGQRPVPPFRAKGPSKDNRLQPAEVRTILYPIPEGTRTVTARLEYLLGPAPLLRAAGIPAAEAEPVVVSKAELAF